MFVCFFHPQVPVDLGFGTGGDVIAWWDYHFSENLWDICFVALHFAVYLSFLSAKAPAVLILACSPWLSWAWEWSAGMACLLRAGYAKILNLWVVRKSLCFSFLMYLSILVAAMACKSICASVKCWSVHIETAFMDFGCLASSVALNYRDTPGRDPDGKYRFAAHKMLLRPQEQRTVA